jgi:hypothetical protein
MRIHAIQTGTVRIKTAQVEGRGHGLADKMAKAMNTQIRGVIADELKNQLRPGGVLFGPNHKR